MDDQIQFKYQEVFIETENNLRLKSWIIEKDLINKKTLVFFHGNAGNLSNRTYKLNQLNKLDTQKIEPLNSIIDKTVKPRSDKINDGKIKDEILKNSPNKDNDFFIVPKVVE